MSDSLLTTRPSAGSIQADVAAEVNEFEGQGLRAQGPANQRGSLEASV